ncbi:MAG: hypothetical protein K0R94_1570 [Burkholderiales bacterium]|jgi:hypothetical protein|nr:hypothetical protein [Burkholderiales bacterium]
MKPPHYNFNKVIKTSRLIFVLCAGISIANATEIMQTGICHYASEIKSEKVGNQVIVKWDLFKNSGKMHLNVFTRKSDGEMQEASFKKFCTRPTGDNIAVYSISNVSVSYFVIPHKKAGTKEDVLKGKTISLEMKNPKTDISLDKQPWKMSHGTFSKSSLICQVTYPGAVQDPDVLSFHRSNPSNPVCYSPSAAASDKASEVREDEEGKKD